MSINEKELLAIKHYDESYDGKFFYGLLKTGVFCRPSCKYSAAKKERVIVYTNMEEAYASGLRPCTRCRPELLDSELMTELTSQVKNIYDHYFDDYEQMSYELKQLNVSQNHIERLFFKKYDISSLEYIHKLRIEKGENLLRNTNMTVLNIAYTCGYGTASKFNYYFKQHFAVTPKEYRKISNYCQA